MLEDPELSWKKKMSAILELFNGYRNRQEYGVEAEKMRAIPSSVSACVAFPRVCLVPPVGGRP